MWTDSLPSIAGVGCGLVCIGAGEEQARKVLALRGLKSEGQVGLVRGTRWPMGSSAGRMVQEEQDDVVVEPVRAVSLIGAYLLSIKPEPVQGSG